MLEHTQILDVALKQATPHRELSAGWVQPLRCQGWDVEQMFPGLCWHPCSIQNLDWGLDPVRGHNSFPCPTPRSWLPYTAIREPEQGEAPSLWDQFPAPPCLCCG